MIVPFGRMWSYAKSDLRLRSMTYFFGCIFWIYFGDILHPSLNHSPVATKSFTIFTSSVERWQEDSHCAECNGGYYLFSRDCQDRKKMEIGGGSKRWRRWELRFFFHIFREAIRNYIAGITSRIARENIWIQEVLILITHTHVHQINIVFHGIVVSCFDWMDLRIDARKNISFFHSTRGMIVKQNGFNFKKSRSLELFQLRVLEGLNNIFGLEVVNWRNTSIHGHMTFNLATSSFFQQWRWTHLTRDFFL